jgi:hypothetical protein
MLSGTSVPPPQLDEFFSVGEAPLRSVDTRYCPRTFLPIIRPDHPICRAVGLGVDALILPASKKIGSQSSTVAGDRGFESNSRLHRPIKKL